MIHLSCPPAGSSSLVAPGEYLAIFEGPSLCPFLFSPLTQLFSLCFLPDFQLLVLQILTLDFGFFIIQALGASF